jgi:hypothetical protein
MTMMMTMMMTMVDFPLYSSRCSTPINAEVIVAGCKDRKT